MTLALSCIVCEI